MINNNFEKYIIHQRKVTDNSLLEIIAFSTVKVRRTGNPGSVRAPNIIETARHIYLL